MRIMSLAWLFFVSTAFGLTETTLSNGLRVLVKERTMAPVASVVLCYHVGGSDEPDGLTGISHLLEHIMFQGGQDTAPGAMSRFVEAKGGYINAFTGQDSTCFVSTIAAEYVPDILAFEASRMRDLLVEAQGFSKEKQVVLEERRMRVDDHPEALFYERFRAMAFLKSPYHNPVIGWLSDVNQLGLKDAQAWYRRFYVPNNAVLVVLGGVDPKKTLAQVKASFGTIEKGAVIERKRRSPLARFGSRNLQFYADTMQPRTVLAYDVPSIKTSEKSWYPRALYVLATLLSNTHGLFQEYLVNEKKLVSFVGVGYSPLVQYSQQFYVHLVPRNKVSRETLLQGVREVFLRIEKGLFTKAQLQAAIVQIQSDHLYQEDSFTGQAEGIAALSVIGISPEAVDHFYEQIESVTKSQVVEVAHLFLNESHLTFGEMIPVAHQKKSQG